MPLPEERIQAALEIARKGGFDKNETDHLLWMVDQMVRTLCGDEPTYRKWVEETCAGADGTPNVYNWDVGTPP